MNRIKVNLIAIFVISIALTFILNRIVDYYKGPSLIIDVHFNKEAYKAGDLIIIEVHAYNRELFWGKTPIKGLVFAVQIVDPRGNTVFVFRNVTDSNGKTTFMVRVAKWWHAGEYKVYIVTPGFLVIKTIKVD